MFRRAKLMLDSVSTEVMAAALRAGGLLASLRLTDAHGRPLCAQVRPPLIHWSPARTDRAAHAAVRRCSDRKGTDGPPTMIKHPLVPRLVCCESLGWRRELAARKAVADCARRHAL
jgi:hypothetical protein